MKGEWMSAKKREERRKVLVKIPMKGTTYRRKEAIVK
jgi:hypothetical protein